MNQPRPCRLAGPWAVCALCLLPSSSAAQIGLSKAELLKKPGVGFAYKSDRNSPIELCQSPPTADDPARRTYFLFEDRVAGLTIDWRNQQLTYDEALIALNGVSGLPEFKVTNRKPLWRPDERQLEVFPPLGAWEQRPIRVPVFGMVTGVQAQWEAYYNKWGDYLGSSDVRFKPLITVYTRFAGDFAFQATKLPVPLIRGDGSAYAWLEVSGNSMTEQCATNQLFIAEPEVYWRIRYDGFRGFEGVQPSTTTLDQLRPYHLEVGDDYERTLLEHVPLNVAKTILHGWRINATLGAVDDLAVSPATLRHLSQNCDQELLKAALVVSMKSRPTDVAIRRAELLDSLGSLRWVPELSVKLKVKSEAAKVAKTMRILAAHHGATASELKDLGRDPARWNQWYKRVK